MQRVLFVELKLRTDGLGRIAVLRYYWRDRALPYPTTQTAVPFRHDRLYLIDREPSRPVRIRRFKFRTARPEGYAVQHALVRPSYVWSKLVKHPHRGNCEVGYVTRPLE